MGRLTHTHTHTYYFGQEDTAALRKTLEAMRADFDHRKDHISKTARHAGEARLTTLEAAILLAEDPVVE